MRTGMRQVDTHRMTLCAMNERALLFMSAATNACWISQPVIYKNHLLTCLLTAEHPRPEYTGINN